MTKLGMDEVVIIIAEAYDKKNNNKTSMVPQESSHNRPESLSMTS